MDLGTLVGFLAGAFFIIFSIILSASFDMAKVAKIGDPASAMITIGGSIAAIFIGYPVKTVINAFKQIKIVFKPPNFDPQESINTIIEYANLARKEGVLALEDAASSLDDAFLKKGIMLIVDGTDAELIKNILETEIAYVDTRHGEVRGVWDFLGSMGPAFGMIGTLIGLTMMLQDLSNPDELGPKMAIAILTTFYGSVIANYLAGPVSNKLKVINEAELIVKEMQIEGLLSILAGENPRIIEEKLKSFLKPSMRSVESDAGGE